MAASDLKHKILVVEDEVEINQLLQIILRNKGYEVSAALDGLAALEQIQNHQFDLILLDWMIPQINGLEFIKHLRNKNNLTPVVFVTAKTQPDDIVLGLEAGADDYLVKPFDTSVLLARIDSVLRRYSYQPAAPEKKFTTLKYRTLSMNLDTYEVQFENNPLHLTRSEFRILSELIISREKVLTRDQLVEKTQGEGVNVTSRTIDTHVFGLRKKLGAHGDWIETIRGVGYRLLAEDKAF